MKLRNSIYNPVRGGMATLFWPNVSGEYDHCSHVALQDLTPRAKIIMKDGNVYKNTLNS